VLTVAETFGFRFPEPHSGGARAGLSGPVFYPAACHPQAWLSVSVVLIARSSLGLELDVPNGVARLRPLRSRRR
jgi:hypothetical protein